MKVVDFDYAPHCMSPKAYAELEQHLAQKCNCFRKGRLIIVPPDRWKRKENTP